MAEGKFGLAEAVEALRTEMIEAVRQGSGEWMRFGLAPIEVTLQAVVTKAANGKVGWWVLEAGGSFESAVTQTVKVTLIPTVRSPDGTYTTQFSIAGDLEPGAGFGPEEKGTNPS